MEGRLMVMAPPCARSLCVAKENVVTDDVFFKETRSRSDIIMLTPCTWPCSMARLVAPALARLTVVTTVSPKPLDSNGSPVVSSPAPNVMLCGPPAGNVPPDVVHTMLSTTDVIEQLDKDAVPECATSTPTGAVFWVK